MAVAITNTVQSNPFSGLMGLTPKQKSPSSIGGVQTTTPSQVSQTSMKTPSVMGLLTGNDLRAKTPTPSLPQPQMGSVQMPQQKSAPSLQPTQQAQPQFQAAQSSPVQIQPPAGTANGILPPQQPQTSSRGLFSSVASSLAQKGNEVNPITQESVARARAINDELKTSRENEARAIGQQGLAPIPMGDITGRQAVIRNQYLAQQNALTGQLSAETTLAGIGTAQQNAQQSALSTLGSLTPEALRFDTMGGTGNGSLSPSSRAQSLAQQVKSGLLSPEDAERQMSSLYGGVGATFLNQALQGGEQGFNYNQAKAQSAAQQSNIQTQGTAQTEIARAGLQEATNNYVNMTAAADFAVQQSGAVTQILQATGLNNVSSTDYNKGLNTLKSRFSDTQFTSLNTAIREAQIAYTNLLSTGGITPTGSEAQALATLNINQSAGAIKASIQQLDNAVARRLQSQYGAMQTYQTNLQGIPSQQQSGVPQQQGGQITWDNLEQYN